MEEQDDGMITGYMSFDMMANTTGILNISMRAKTHGKIRIPTEKYFFDGVPSENNTQK